jgi:catechol 2,3-dioxygenase-like lactoylglutathione lyase family enzyme
MDTRDDAPAAGPLLIEIEIADEPPAWADAGFSVVDGLVQVGAVGFRLTGSGAADGRRGIVGWTVSGIEVDDHQIDGLPTKSRSETVFSAPSTSPVHPNGVTGLDHIVVLTPDLDRTIAAFESTGLDLRRIRETTSYGSPMRQAFFRMGPTVIEVVSGDLGVGQPASDAPATWFGLAVDVHDLDQTAEQLGEGLGSIKVAVQPGRRIATLRHKAFGLSVAIAAMDHHADR